MNTPTRPKAQAELRARLPRFIGVGAALGLYFGLFFRPARAPDLLMAVGLAAVAALVMALLKWRRDGGKPSRSLAIYAARTFVLYALALGLLETRHYAYDLGGRTAVTILTTGMGALTGALMARWNRF